jgi:hypothetical protein
MDPHLLGRRDAPCSERRSDWGLDNLQVSRFCLPDCVRGCI